MYDYNKPLKETDFDFISYDDNGKNKNVLQFSVNGEYYRQTYNYGNGYGFKFIDKYPNKITFEQGIFGNCQTIYSSTLEKECTDEGRFIEYSLSKIDLNKILSHAK